MNTELNLILPGGTRCDRNRLAEIQPPKATESWHPIPHISLVEQVEKALTAQNMRIVAEAHGTSNNGDRYFGMLQVANCQNSADYAYILGLRNSQDKTFPAGLAVGSRVLVCSNLSFSGEITIARKHTSRILVDLPGLTTRAVGQLAERWNDQDKRIAAYKETELTDAKVHDFLIRSLDVDACTTQQIPKILTQWRRPNHAEFAESKTAWRLFNAFTEVHKETSLWLMPKRTMALHALMDAQAGLLAAKN